jgi:hypothetical protein
MRPLILSLAVIVIVVSGSPVLADGKNPTYVDDVTPVLRQHCLGCHGNDKQKGGLNLATYVEMQKGGGSGTVVTPGNPDKSRLFTLVDHREEPKMPSSSQKIPAEQIALIKLWIEQGAKENSGSKVNITAMPKTDIGLKSVVKGRPEGPPPMPGVGKLRLEPVVTARRPGAVLALATSPWAPILAVGGQKQVILYNTDTGALLGVIPFDHGQINSIKFSRNARFLLVAGGRGGQSGKAVLFNVETGEKIVEVGSETDAILAADLSADQSQIAVGGPGKIIRVYSTLDGSVLREIKKHTDWVTAVEFSPDGVLLATGDRNGGLFVWEAFTGREYFSLRGHTAMITDLSWRDDSNVLASSSEDTTIKLWEMENGGMIKNWGAHAGGAASIRFAHDGKLASTGRDKVTKLWDQNGAIQKQFEPFPDLGLRVAVTHENAKVIGGDWSGLVKTWNVADAKIVATVDTNLLPLTERLKQAEGALAAATSKMTSLQAAYEAAIAKAKQATEAHAAALSNLNKINADLTAANKASADLTIAANAAKLLMESSKQELDKASPLALTSSNKAAALEITVLAETTAARAIADAAAKTPQNPELAVQAKKAADALAALQNELVVAKKAATDTATVVTTITAKFTTASKSYTDALAAVGAQQKIVATLTPLLKPATDAVAPVKAALDVANAAVGPAKAARDAASAEVARAQASLDALKAVSPTPPSPMMATPAIALPKK